MPNAEIYQKTASDRVLIIEPQVGWLQPFNVGSWTQLAIGLWWSATTEADDNAVPTTAITGTGSATNLMTFGLKESSLNLPGESGTRFIGYTASNALATATSYIIATSTEHRIIVSGAFNGRGYFGSILDTTFSVTLNTPNSGFANPGNNMSTSSNYCNFFGMKFVVLNSGLSTQQIEVYSPNATNVTPTSTPTIESLRTTFLPSLTTLVHTAAWNDGASAYALPTAMFLRFPFTGIRARIHAFVIEKLL